MPLNVCEFLEYKIVKECACNPKFLIHPFLTPSLLQQTQEIQCQQKERGVNVYQGKPRNLSAFPALIVSKTDAPPTAANKHHSGRLILLRLNLDSKGVQATMSITLLQGIQDRVPISLCDDDIVARIDSDLLQSSLAIASYLQEQAWM
jgi:hypothetical protein